MAKKALLIGINHYQIPGNDLRERREVNDGNAQKILRLQTD